jgi:hypothetical protein
MIWLEIAVMTLIVIAVAAKFYNIGYNECRDDYEEKYDFKNMTEAKAKEIEGEKNES